MVETIAPVVYGEDRKRYAAALALHTLGAGAAAGALGALLGAAGGLTGAPWGARGALVLAAVAGALISSTRSVSAQRLRAAATRVVTDHLETLRTLPFGELDAQAGRRITTTAGGRTFTVDTAVATVDAATGESSPTGRVKQVTAVVSWTSNGARREVSYTTAMAAGQPTATVQQAIGTVTMFPNPATTDASGRPLEDIAVTVPLTGFPPETLVHLSWTNADGTAGAKTLTSGAGINWRGTVTRDQLLIPLGTDGRGEIQFTVSAGTLGGIHTLAAQRVAGTPPVVTSAVIDRNPITVALPRIGRTCADRNQCRNTTDVTITVTVDGLDPAQDSVIVQYQLFDATFHEVPLAPSGGQWRVTVRQKTTKFLTGTSRTFRFTAIRTADGATATATVLRDVVST